MARDLFDVIRDAAQHATYRPRKGSILSVGPTRALVLRDGTQTPIPCEYDPQAGVAVGKRCVVDWIPGRQFVITSVFGAPNTIRPGDQPAGALELAPPSGVTASSALPGCILVSWEVPAQLSVTFEVQRNSSAVEAGAVTVAMTRGDSYVDSAGSAAFFRVRSVTTTWQRSGWSAWVSGTPGEMSGLLTDLTDVALTSLTNDDLFVWIAADGTWENRPLDHFTDRILTDDDGEPLTDDNGNVLLGDP